MSELLQIEFIDDNFTVERSAEYQLLIKEDKSNFQMAILDDENHLLLLLSWQKDTLEERVKHLLGLSYKFKRISLNTKNILLVPSELYNSNQEISYLNLLYLSKAENRLLVDHIEDLSLYLLHSRPVNDLETMTVQFPNTSFIARNTVLLSAFRNLLKEKTYYAINFNGEYTDFSYFFEDRLVYHHSHPNQHVEEFNYFLLAIAKEHQIDLSNVPIYLSGKINEDHAYYTCLMKYNKKIQFVDLSDIVECKNYKVQQKAYHSLSLFGLLCV